MTVVYTSDGNDIELLRASIHSVKKSSGGNADIFVLSDVLSGDVDGAEVVDLGSALWDLGVEPYGWNRAWPYTAITRLALPLLDRFSACERVLYLDTDTLAVSDDLSLLFDIPDNGSEILCARDSNGTSERIRTCLDKDISREARDEIVKRVWEGRSIQEHVYANTGVAVWCLGNIRKNGLDWYRRRVRWFWEGMKKGGFPIIDQDFSNSMMVMSTVLDQRFNRYADRRGGPESIVHFVCGTKSEMLKEAARRTGYVQKAGREYPVVYASDGKDARDLSMSAFSVRACLGPGARIHILTERSSYPEVPGATLVNPYGCLEGFGFTHEMWRSRRWPLASMFRLAVPLLEEFDGYDDVLYLDTDTMARNSGVRMLFDVASDGFEVHGVQDIEDRQWDIEDMMMNDVPRCAFREMHERLWKRRATAANGYINSGVLVMHLKQIRDNGLDWYRKRLGLFLMGLSNGRFRFPDQGFINVMMDVCPSLSVKFNRFGGDYGTRCTIQHLVGKCRSAMPGIARGMGYRGHS